MGEVGIATRPFLAADVTLTSVADQLAANADPLGVRATPGLVYFHLLLLFMFQVHK